MDNTKVEPQRTAKESVEIRVRGTVQGVGFRPTVWRLANEAGLTGEVNNDHAGVLIRTTGPSAAIKDFVERLRIDSPPLSDIEAIQTRSLNRLLEFEAFHIVDSVEGENQTRVTPDAATCAACVEEVLDPAERRYRYPFANCTHCGPRFSIVRKVPYDRANTTMAPFPLCEACMQEFEDPADRRFHAQPIACPKCGPHVWFDHLETEGASRLDADDAVNATVQLLKGGQIAAIRGLGGFHLACDASNPEAVKRLRMRKHRYGKPFALMARDMEVIRSYARVSAVEQELLESAESPIVLLREGDSGALPETLAPGLDVLGFMLPYTPLHLLIMREMAGPLVMTSGNTSDEPQVTGVDEARNRLSGIADAGLMHNRDIVNRIDDSVVRVMSGKPRLLRRARGYAPAALPLPEGFAQSPDLLAYGGELKATFCLVKDGAAVLSAHQGDLEDCSTFEDYQKNLRLFADIYDHKPRILAADLHPEYLSTKLAKERSEADGLPISAIQHHHAHVASCMVENGLALDSPPVLGIALDGLGYGEDGSIWGGEFMIASYREYQRVATFKPVAMLGGGQAIREPWRNTYAHLSEAFGWPQFADQFGEIPLHQELTNKPLATLDRMLDQGINVPLASSCGRLFDAVAAAIGCAFEVSQYQGQGGMELEALADRHGLDPADGAAYPFAILRPTDSDNAIPILDPTPMWEALMADLCAGASNGAMAARFHRGLAAGIRDMVQAILTKGAKNLEITSVAISGGCAQNKVLLEELVRLLEHDQLKVLLQAKVPANDGGLSLGQAAIACARALDEGE